MKKMTMMLLIVAVVTVFVTGCTLSEKFSKSSGEEAAISANVKCANCESNIDVSGLEKGCDIKCPACSNVCTY